MTSVSKYFKAILLTGFVFVSCNNAGNENNSEDSGTIQQQGPVAPTDSIISASSIISLQRFAE
jgi:hypothetical protein